MLQACTSARRTFRGRSVPLAILVALGATAPAFGQLTSADVAALRQRAEHEDWTFTVGENPATGYRLDELCGLKVPDEGWSRPPRIAAPPPVTGLPDQFDWRTLNGCTPIKDQGGCGSCWAFVTVGTLECNILIQDGVTVDLSEQWLVSCNTDGYNCESGGWMAHDYHLSTPDACGASGAVLEADFPYAAAVTTCNCPYPRAYHIADWGYISDDDSMPAVEDIKRAIYNYGPISVAVYVDASFTAYISGVFNASAFGEINHGVILVGWDDNQGADGVWILRNSWGPGWGEAGYMRIEYGCSRVGFGASYIVYEGPTPSQLDVSPATIAFGELAVGQTATATVTVTNVGGGTLAGDAVVPVGPFLVDDPDYYLLEAGESATLTVRFNPALAGAFSREILLSGGDAATITVTGTATGTNTAADECDYAPAIAEGTYHADNTTAATDAAVNCGAADAGDVWWLFTPTESALTTIDTVGSAIDTVLSVYGACDDSALECNDDADEDDPTGASSVALDALAGRTYPVRVAGNAEETGGIVLRITTDQPSFTITGRVIDEGAFGLEGVTLTGLPGDPVTDADGVYATVIEYGFSGVATPTKTGWEFQPAERTYAHTTASVAAADYFARTAVFTISGQITDTDGTGLAGVVLDGLGATVVTNFQGRYSAAVEYGSSATVAPELSGYAFEPAERVYEAVDADLSTENYLAAPFVGELRITLEPEAAVGDGAAWRVDGGDWQASGEISSGLAVGNRRVTYASLPGWAPPAAETVTINYGTAADLARSYTLTGYVLTVRADPPAGGSVTIDPTPGPSGLQTADTVVTLTARPRAGYGFHGWVRVDEVLGTSGDVARVAMTTDRTVVAEFGPTLVAGTTGQMPLGEVPLPCGGGGACGAGYVGILPLILCGLCGLKCGRQRWWRTRR